MQVSILADALPRKVHHLYSHVDTYEIRILVYICLQITLQIDS